MKKQPINNQYAIVLQDLGKGDILNEASKSLAKVMSAVKDTGKKGKITVEMIVNEDGDRLSIAGKVITTIPKVSSRPIYRYLNDEGGIQKNDPDQEEMRPVVAEAEKQSEEKDSGAARQAAAN